MIAAGDSTASVENLSVVVTIISKRARETNSFPSRKDPKVSLKQIFPNKTKQNKTKKTTKSGFSGLDPCSISPMYVRYTYADRLHVRVGTKLRLDLAFVWTFRGTIALWVDQSRTSSGVSCLFFPLSFLLVNDEVGYIVLVIILGSTVVLSSVINTLL